MMQKEINSSQICAQNRGELVSSDVFIASYPRSGNTWVRLLLSDVLLQRNGFATCTELPIHQDTIIPDIHKQNIDQIDPRVRLDYRIIKTHEEFYPAVQKVIFLFRRPADALVSYYHFHLRREHLAQKVRSGINTFCQERLTQWRNHVISYVQAHLTQTARVCFVSYEALHAQPVQTLERMVSFLGLPFNANMCYKAVANHHFEKHRHRERNLNTGRKPFFRKGKVGTGVSELDASTAQLIGEQGDSIYHMAQRIESFQVQQKSTPLQPQTVEGNKA